MRIVWISDIKKVANELSGLFAKVSAPQADNDSSNPPEIFHKKEFISKIVDRNTLYSYRKSYI